MLAVIAPMRCSACVRASSLVSVISARAICVASKRANIRKSVELVSRSLRLSERAPASS